MPLWTLDPTSICIVHGHADSGVAFRECVIQQSMCIIYYYRARMNDVESHELHFEPNFERKFGTTGLDSQTTINRQEMARVIDGYMRFKGSR